METGAGNRVRNIMRIRNLTRTGIILALGTERLYLEPTRKSAIVRWTQNTIGITCSHFEFGAPYECLQVPILEDIAHVEGLPDPEPGTVVGRNAKNGRRSCSPSAMRASGSSEPNRERRRQHGRPLLCDLIAQRT